MLLLVCIKSNIPLSLSQRYEVSASCDEGNIPFQKCIKGEFDDLLTVCILFNYSSVNEVRRFSRFGGVHKVDLHIFRQAIFSKTSLADCR